MWAVKYEAKCEKTMGTHVQNPSCSAWAQIQPWVLMVAAPSKMLGLTAGAAGWALTGHCWAAWSWAHSALCRGEMLVSTSLGWDIWAHWGLWLVKTEGESPRNLCLRQRWPKYHCRWEYHSHILVQAYTRQFSVFPVQTSLLYMKAQLVRVSSDMTFHYTWLLLYKILKKREAISSTLLTQKCKTIL